MNTTLTRAASYDVSAVDLLVPDEMLSGSKRYQDFQPIGVGGKAEVFRCYDANLNREVAFKVLHKELAASPLEQQMLMREARIMASLQSKSVPAVHELGRDQDGRPYFTMEFVHGKSLHELIHRMRLAMQDPSTAINRGPDLEELLGFVAHVARVLDDAHRNGIVHADLKPENIVVDARGFVSLIDWGIARIMETARTETSPPSIDESWGRQGSPLFMSPEQVSRARYLSPASDVFSLGIVLYECLTLRVPFLGRNSSQTLRMIARDTAVAPSQLAPERRITKQLDEICATALAKDPDSRFENMERFAEALLNAQQELLINFEREMPLV